MKLTAQHMKEFFPSDRRFLYYVAKEYGLSFYNEEVVNTANYKAAVEMTKIYNEGKEFEDRFHLYGYVKSVFRFAILNAYRKKANDNIEIENHTDLTGMFRLSETQDAEEIFGGSREYHYDDNEKVLESLSKTLSPLEYGILSLRINNDLRWTEIRMRLGITEVQLRNAINRIRTKYKNNKKELEFYERKKESTTNSSSTQTNTPIPRGVGSQSFRSNKATAGSYNQAVAWLHTED